MMFLRSLIAILSLVWIPAAQANTLVWFETANVNSWDSDVPGGAPGTTLTVFCDNNNAPGVCTWQISMRAALGTGGITGWSLDLGTTPGNGVSLTVPQIAPGNPFNDAASPGTAGAGPALLNDARGQSFVPISPQTLTLMTFTLRQSYTVPNGNFNSFVFGGPSASDLVVWGNDAANDYEVVQFGPNPPAPGFEGTVGTLPLIRIMYPIPEPASLTLLAFGAVVCLRRTRGHRDHILCQN